MSELQQTKGYFKVRGIIVGKDNPKKGNGYREGTTSTGKDYRSIRFLVRTAENNIVPVEKFGMELDFAYAYSKEKKTSKSIPFNKRHSAKLPEGFELIKPDYDVVEDINDTFKDGDSVCVVGEIQFNEYEGNLQKKYIIKGRDLGVYATKEPIDFDAENFKEVSMFEQEIIINSVEKDTERDKLAVNAYIVSYNKKPYPAYFEVDTSKDDKTHQEFVKKFQKLKHGDFLKVNGIIHYRSIGKQVQENDGWGTSVESITTYYKEIEITGADASSVETKKYKEDDLVTEVEVKKETKKKANKILEIAEEVNEDEGNDKLPFDL